MFQKKIWLCLMLFFSVLPLSSAQDIYWENPRTLVPEGVYYYDVKSQQDFVVILWQEFVERSSGGGDIYLSLISSHDSKKWKENRRFLGPFKYTDKQNRIYSLALDERGRIFLALSTGQKQTTLYMSDDEGQNFRSVEITSGFPVVSPLLYIMGDGKLLLFVTHALQEEGGENLSIFYYIIGEEVFTQTRMVVRFQPFVDNPELVLNFLPYHSSFDGREYVVFQSTERGKETGYFQLYLKSSQDFGLTWSPVRLITGFQELRGTAVQTVLPYSQFSNQRPVMAVQEGKLHILWERQYLGGNSQIYSISLEDTGLLEPAQRISESSANCYSPRMMSYNDSNYVLWFDNSRGIDRIFMAFQNKDGSWVTQDLSAQVEGKSQFPDAFFIGNELYLLWANTFRNQNSLYLLAPDRSVIPPRVSSPDFQSGGKNTKTWINFVWNIPEDSSNIGGFYYRWSQDPALQLSELTAVLGDITSVRVAATRDGLWYFHLMAEDYANNRSAAVVVVYERDTKPPERVLFEPVLLDEEGFLASNTFEISWSPYEKDRDVAGYASSLQWLGSIDFDVNKLDWSRITPPKRTVQTLSRSRVFTNVDNGVWAFTVVPIDDVGNVGAPTTQLLRLNKFKPFTLVSELIKSRNELGVDTLILSGRGFNSDGFINTIYLDADGKAPYDHTFRLADGDFKIASDRRIDSLTFRDIVGRFRVIVVHDTRGVHLAAQAVEFDSFGNLKILPPLPASLPYSYEKALQPRFLLSVNEIMVWLGVVIFVVVILATLFKLLGIMREGQQLESELLEIMQGPGDVKLRRERMKQRIKLKGAGLRLKFTMLMSVLVILILAMVSIPLSFYMIKTQRENLADGLKSQVNVMLGSLASSARDYLAAQDDLQLGLLPANSRVLESVVSVTVTGVRKRDTEAPTDKEYVWATNDEHITERLAPVLDAAGNGLPAEFRRGQSVLVDEISPRVAELAAEINRQAVAEVSSLQATIGELSGELTTLVLKQDALSVARRDELSLIISQTRTTIEEKLLALSNKIESVPFFDNNALQPLYTFYKPIVFRYGTQEVFMRGMVRLVVSTESIQQKIGISQKDILWRIVLFSLIALALGILVAIVLASLIIMPLQKLVSGVAFIRDTSDKSELKGHLIDIKQKDEIRMLADTINEMTQGLVKAAMANKDLIVGKETQKMFIPLQKDESGKKGTTGEEKTAQVEIFGYYEGAKGVSGDYFDFKKLDDKHYCVIKCDVAGKGVPAALIMVEVATIFIDYFRNWNPQAPKIEIPQLVYRMNDLIEERGFKGRFAALTVAIINVQTGVGYFCNAGDKDIHIFNAQKGKIELHKMPEAPATGVFPSMLVEMQSGFKQVKFKIDHGDAFFLWTDGLDESKRIFRDEDFNIIKCAQPGLKEGDDHGGTHNWGTSDEELGATRLYAVINAVFSKSSYQLKKFHSPVPSEILTFDFSRCEGTVREAVLAMISLEKVFRLYKSSKIDESSRVIVDKKVDAFLREHFVQYDDYFIHREELPDNPTYVAFTHLREDEQYDDLTLLAIRKI